MQRFFLSAAVASLALRRACSIRHIAGTDFVGLELTIPGSRLFSVPRGEWPFSTVRSSSAVEVGRSSGIPRSVPGWVSLGRQAQANFF